MFAYKVLDTGDGDIWYKDTPFQNCVVQEIQVRNIRNVEAILPSQFGFLPKAEVEDQLP